MLPNADVGFTNEIGTASPYFLSVATFVPVFVKSAPLTLNCVDIVG